MPRIAEGKDGNYLIHLGIQRGGWRAHGAKCELKEGNTKSYRIFPGLKI